VPGSRAFTAGVEFHHPPKDIPDHIKLSIKFIVHLNTKSRQHQRHGGSTDASKCLKILRVQKLAFLSPIPKFFRKISVLHVAAHPFQAILLLLTYYSTFKWAYG
jgi:hypothetical protein